MHDAAPDGAKADSAAVRTEVTLGASCGARQDITWCDCEAAWHRYDERWCIATDAVNTPRR